MFFFLMVGFPNNHGVFLLKMISTWGVLGYHYFRKHPYVESEKSTDLLRFPQVMVRWIGQVVKQRLEQLIHVDVARLRDTDASKGKVTSL